MQNVAGKPSWFRAFFEEAPLGLLKFSAVLRHVVQRWNISLDQRLRVISLLHNGITDPQRYARISGKDIDLRSVGADAITDYFRCILATGLDNAFNNLTARYRNESARKKFFENLATLTERIHPIRSDTDLIELFRQAARDRLTRFVARSSLQPIRKRQYPDDALNRLVETANQEFGQYLEQMERLTGIRRETAERYLGSVRIESFFDPWYVEDEKTAVWGVSHYPSLGLIVIWPPLLFFTAVRRGVLAREAANIFIPKIIEQVEYIFEQSEYFAYKILEHKHEKEFWLLARHGPRQDTRRWAERIMEFFPFYESLVGEGLYRDLWARLDEHRRLSIPITSFMEYQEIFRALAAKPVRARFDEKELEMLRILSTEPFLPFSDMSRRLRLSMPTTMRLFTNLSAKSSLSSFLMANVDLLGLTDFFMFMNTSRKSELRRILFRIPYCRVVYSLYGSADVFALIDVPFQESEFPRKMADRLRSAGVASQVILCRSEHNFGGLNFQSYDLKAKDWDIHWNSWGGILRERLSAMSKVNMVSLHHQPNKLEWIRKIDLQIMERLFSNCRRSHEQIGDMLGVTGAYVGKRVRRLLQNNVFRPVMAPRKMGAEDHGLLLLSCPRDRVGIIASGFDLLPRWRGAQVSGDVEGLLAEVYVPTGQIDQLFKQVDEQLVARHFVDGCRFHVVGTWSQPIVRWLPANLYSDETGWAFDSEKYLALVP